ncbi:DUF1345 domain-containing protein [Floridanema evergladense]|uniref:DUF1345 domain-containing protein n=1 Tax=Floridaenema evergladense BLCC-F167 TaxID=3153639 RepID=A0ABV4WUR3_9CYAN
MKLAVIRNRIEQPKFRLVISLGIAVIIFMCCVPRGLEFQLLAAWTGGVISFLFLIWSMMLRANAARTRLRSQQQELDNWLIFFMAIAATFSSLFVIGFIVVRFKDTLSIEVGLSILAVFCSWLSIHTLFAHHYASFYYRPVDENSAANSNTKYNGGLQFSGGMPPCYSDFLYFAFVIGMTAQTSDIPIVKSAMRRLSLGHMVISYYFYSVILALGVSVVIRLI